MAPWGLHGVVMYSLALTVRTRLRPESQGATLGSSEGQGQQGVQSLRSVEGGG